jgi:hypothetical protein
VDLSILLTQNGQTVQGDATVTAGKSAIHIPISMGVLTPDSKLSLEGETSNMVGKAHLSFDGKAESGKITGTAHLVLSNVRGGADNHGPVTLTPAG